MTQEVFGDKDYEEVYINALGEDPVGRIWVCWTHHVPETYIPQGVAAVLGKTGRALLENKLKNQGKR